MTIRRIRVMTNMLDDLLNIELDVVKQFNIQPNDSYVIEVHDENNTYITTLENIKTPPI
jgi:transketolase C-terminal domain/subunit